MNDTVQSSITCRKALPDDIQFIYDCLRSSASDAGLEDNFSYTTTTMQDALFSANPYAECIIAEINLHPIGLMVYSIMHNNFQFFPSPGMYVHDVFVLKDYRLHGIARRMGSYLINIANERKCSRIEGMVAKNEESVQSLFKTFRGLQKVDDMEYLRLLIPARPNEG